jgi:hypothetical protein
MPALAAWRNGGTALIGASRFRALFARDCAQQRRRRRWLAACSTAKHAETNRGMYAAAVIALTVASACGGSPATGGVSAGGGAGGSVAAVGSGAGGMPASTGGMPAGAGGTLGGADGAGCTGGSSGDNALLCQHSEAGGGVGGGLQCQSRSIPPGGACDFPGECRVLPSAGRMCCPPGGCSPGPSLFACSCGLDHTLQCVGSDDQSACMGEGGATDGGAP